MGTATLTERRHRLLVSTAVLTVFVALHVYVEWLPLSPLAWIQQRFQWNFAFHTWLILIPIFALALRLGSPKGYGLALPRSFRTLGVGATIFLILALLPFLGEVLFAQVRVQPRLVGYIPHTVLFQFVFSAFGEELFFRGFIQGSFNAAYGRPWRWGATPYGLGLVAASVLFGVAHLVAPFSPHLGVYGLDWSAFAWTTVGGFLFGLARERSGTLIVPILLHAGINVYQTIFVMDTPGMIGFAAAVCICYPLLAIWCATPQTTPEAAAESPEAAEPLHDGPTC